MPKTIGRLPAAAAPPEQLTSLLTDITTFWDANGYLIVLAALFAATAFLVTSLWIAHKRKHAARWVSNVASVTVLILTSEGMWEVIRGIDTIPLPVAISAFFVGEAMMISAAMRAAEKYAKTTVKDKETGEILTAGDPGKSGTFVWVLASVFGLIVALNSGWSIGFPFRLALPLLATYMWWIALTDDGTSRPKGVWRWTPRKILVELGAIEASEKDVETVNRERLIRRMTRLARKLHNLPGDSKSRPRVVERLAKLALDADEAIVEEVHGRVLLAARIADRTAPGRPAGLNDRLDAFRQTVIVEVEQAVQAAVQPVVRAAEQAVHATEQAAAEHRSTLREVQSVHAEQLASARRSIAPVQQWSANGKSAGAEPVQRTGAPAPARQSTPAPERTAAPVQETAPVAMTDEEAVQAMLAVSKDPNHEWVKRDVRKLTGAGFPRVDRLIAEWAERVAALAAVQDQSTPAGAAVQKPGAEPVQAAGAAAEQPVQLTGAGPVQETGAPTNGAAHLVVVGEPEPVAEVSASVR